MSRRKSPAIAALAAAVSGVLILQVVYAEASADTDAPEASDPFDQLTSSDALSTDVLVSGDITHTDGQPASGARVRVLAYPPSDHVDALDAGETFRRTPVALATADRAGYFEARLDPSVALNNFANADGIVDFHLYATDDDLGNLAAFSRQLDDSGAVLHGEAANITEPSDVFARFENLDTAAASSGAPYVPLELRNIAPVVTEQEVLLDEVDDSDVVPYMCSVQPKITHVRTTVARAHHNIKGVRTQSTYGKSQSSSLGWASQYPQGFFEMKGTRSVSKTGDVTSPRIRGKGVKLFRTHFDYYHEACLFDGIVYRTLSPSNWRLGSWHATRAKPQRFPPKKNYGFTGRGHTVRVSKSRASTFAAGVSIKSAININLSAQTGYSTTARTATTVTAQRGAWICGVKGRPDQEPGVIVVRAAKTWPR